jgi:hypothetical protein
MSPVLSPSRQKGKQRRFGRRGLAIGCMSMQKQLGTIYSTTAGKEQVPPAMQICAIHSHTLRPRHHGILNSRPRLGQKAQTSVTIFERARTNESNSRNAIGPSCD